MTSIAPQYTTPFSLKCDTCGAGMEFNIINQNYHCPHCQNTEFIDSKKEKIETWSKQQEEHLKHDHHQIQSMSCPNCGAEVQALADSQTLTCSFCQSNLVKQEILSTTEFPLGLIPFYIQEQEAKDILEKWLDKHKHKEEAKALKGNSSLLRGIYLPYQLYKGPVSGKIRRSNQYNEREFDLATYVNHKAIVTCDNLPNELLDQIEPFDWSAFAPFEFGYLAGLSAKTQDKNYSKSTEDFEQETQSDIYEFTRQMLKTEYIDSSLNISKVTSTPILLPIYYMTANKVSVAINGQTGKLSIFSGKEKKSFPWVVEPILLTLFVWFLTATLIIVSNLKHLQTIRDYLFCFLISPSGELPTMAPALVAAIPIFIVYGEGRSAIITNRFFSSKERFRRQKSSKKLTLAKGASLQKEDLQFPVFYDNYNGEYMPVRIHFLPFKRIFKTVLGFLLLLFAPIFLCMLLYPLLQDNHADLNPYLGRAWFTGQAAWLALTVPLSFILWMKVVRHDFYDLPFVKPYARSGKWMLVEDAASIRENATGFWSFVMENKWFCIKIFAGIVFLLLGSASAMLFQF